MNKARLALLFIVISLALASISSVLLQNCSKGFLPYPCEVYGGLLLFSGLAFTASVFVKEYEA